MVSITIFLQLSKRRLGGNITELDFTMGPNTDVYHSCSATLNGEMFLFGGYDSFTKQVIKQ